MTGKQIKKEDWAWLAGLLEGEGHLGIHIHHRKYRKRSYPLPIIRMRNTDLKMLRAVVQIFGGGIRKVYDGGRATNLGIARKPYYEWFPRQSKIEEIAKNIRPFVRGKKIKIVEKIINFYNRPEVMERRRHWSHPKR